MINVRDIGYELSVMNEDRESILVVFSESMAGIRISHRFCPMITKANRSENVRLFFTEATGTVVTKPVPACSAQATQALLSLGPCIVSDLLNKHAPLPSI